MHCFIFTCLTFILTASCATVGEFPFHELNDSIVEDVTEHTTVHDLEITETVAPDIPNPERQSLEPVTFNQLPSPLFKVIKDFLFQARDGLLDPEGAVMRSIAEESTDEKTQKVVKAFERGVIETTTFLVNQVEDFVVTTIPSVADPSFVDTDFVKRSGEAVSQLTVETTSTGGFLKVDERHIDQISNFSMSCSNCYNTLQSCVQQCFEIHNCNDIERNARFCPPVPNRLCNPFTPWSSVNECQSNKDCKSPLLCCNDGCSNKCIVGVFSS